LGGGGRLAALPWEGRLRSFDILFWLEEEGGGGGTEKKKKKRKKKGRELQSGGGFALDDRASPSNGEVRRGV
jgi:hypothetical protein